MYSQFFFSYFSQSLLPKPNVKPPHISVSKEKHCDAAISAKDNADNPNVKEASKGKSPKATPNQAKRQKSKPVLKLKRCDAKDNADNLNIKKSFKEEIS